MECGICGTDQMKFGTGVETRRIGDSYELESHKRREHPIEMAKAHDARVETRVAKRIAHDKQEAIEQAARQEGREALAMPVVTKAISFCGTGREGQVVYGMHDTSELRPWYLRDNGSVSFGQYGEARLMDVEPQAHYTGLQNQIESLQDQQMALLSLAFEAGPEITVEHLEAVEAAGEKAVERLRSEAE